MKVFGNLCFKIDYTILNMQVMNLLKLVDHTTC